MKPSSENKAPFLRSFLWAIGILFLLFYLGLSVCNRFATDDYYFIYAARELGIKACVTNSYLTFSGRWFAYSVTVGLLNFSTLPGMLILFQLIVVSLLIVALHQLLQKGFQQLEIDLQSADLWCYALLFCSGLFFTTFDKAETWFWFTSICSYLLSIIAFLYLWIELLHAGKRVFAIFRIILLAAFIGGAAESYSFSFLFVLSLLLMVSISKQERLKNIFSSNQRNKIILATVVLLLAMVITAMAPGNAERMSMLPKSGIGAQIMQPLKSLAQLIVHNILPSSLFILLFSIPWFFIGRNHPSAVTMELKKFLKILLIPLFFMLLLLLIFMLPGIILLHETPPGRALSLISFCLYAGCAFVFFCAGRIFQFEWKWQRFSVGIYAIATLLGIGIYASQQIIIAKKYSHAVDERMMELMNRENRNTTAVVKALPPSGLIYSAEISEDIDFHSNRHLQQAMGLPFSIRKN